MDNSRLFLYAALAFVALLIWEQWKTDYGPQPEPAVISDQSQGMQNSNSAQNLPSAEPLDLPQSIDAAQPSQQLASSQLIHVETDVIEAIIDSQGGVLRSLKLKQFPVDLEHPDDYLELVYQRPDERYLIQTGLRSAASPAPTHYSLFQTEKTEYKLEEGQDELRVPLSWQQDGITVNKVFRFHRGDYLVDHQQSISNQSEIAWKGTQYRQIQRTRPLETSKLLYTYTGAVVYNEAIKYEKVSFDDMEGEAFRLQSDSGWIAMIQHYFLSAFIAAPGEQNLVYSISGTNKNPATYTIGMRSAEQEVLPGQQYQFSTQFFVGPKLVDRLEAIAPGLELTVDYGWLTFLSKPLYWILKFFEGITGNWGVAIILLTVLVKAGFFKLSEKAYKSMAKMRKVAPRLQTLKERFGDDRQKLNQAMMDLYKEEKINPVGGCLPMLLQMPVFIALYWALLESVELRQAPFILWIQDLSVMDPFFVLPIIMGVSMVIQQKLSPTPIADPIQAKMMMLLPLVFTVFFAFFPAGLVLYWVSNNILSIAQQYVINKRIDAES